MSVKKSKSTRLNTEFIEIAARLKASGFSYDDIGFYLSVPPSTIQRWKKNNKLFKEAMDDAQKVAVQHLVHAGLRMAMGYEYDEITEDYYTNKAGEEVLKSRKVVKKHRQPSEGMNKFYLINLTKGKFTSPEKIEKEQDSLDIDSLMEAIAK